MGSDAGGSDDDGALIRSRRGGKVVRIRFWRLCCGGANQSKQRIASQQGCGKTEYAKSQARIAETASLFREAQQASDTGRQRSPVCGHGEGRSGTPLLRSEEHTSELQSRFGISY